MNDRDGSLGPRPVAEMLERLLRSGRVPHALLFHGPDGMGKAEAALGLAAALLCKEPSPAACGRCVSCALLPRSHPDYLRITLEPKEPGKDDGGDDDPGGAEPPAAARGLASVIKVEQIRELARLASLAPRYGKRRLFVVDPADRMHAESQNALLKTLEEPAGGAVLILLATRPHLLLPTVRSRCFAVPFAPLGTAELTRWLESEGCSADEAAARAALAAGRPRVARTLDLGPRRERREELLAILESLAASSVAALPAHAATLAGDDEPDLVDGLDLVESLLRDAARAAGADGDALVHADLAPRLIGLGARLGTTRAAALVESAERVRGFLRVNANRTLIADALLAAVAGGPLP